MFREDSACKNPKSVAYSGRIVKSGFALPLASTDLCISSVVILPRTSAKSPQWLVRFHWTLLELGDSCIFVEAVIPLNMSTGSP